MYAAKRNNDKRGMIDHKRMVCRVHHGFTTAVAGVEATAATTNEP